MPWRGTQAASRDRYLAKFDEKEAAVYHSLVGNPGLADLVAYRTDLRRVYSFPLSAKVLDAGAGTGAMCQILSDDRSVIVTALEPSPAMLAILKLQPGLQKVIPVVGFCDALEDRSHFASGSFDVIVSRQLANGLFDPLMAFENWLHWLTPGGTIVLIDGFYGRSAWTGQWAEELDVLPLAASQSISTVPYLLEQVGFRIETVEMMTAVNALPTTRTQRYVVIAKKD